MIFSHIQIIAYPKATAVLVRNHGVYIWGDSWIHAKTQVPASHFCFVMFHSHTFAI